MGSGDARYKHSRVAFFIIHSFQQRGAMKLLDRFDASRPRMSLPMRQVRPSGNTTVIPISSRRERLKFSDFSFTRTPSGQCSAEVSLEWDNVIYTGRAGGQSSPLGDFRVAAEAALRALDDFAKGEMHFELLGVKHVRAFDSDLLIVSIGLRQAGEVTRLVGCYMAETDTRRGAAMAVLNATNRVLGNYIATK
jgi:hypothetical protein